MRRGLDSKNRLSPKIPFNPHPALRRVGHSVDTDALIEGAEKGIEKAKMALSLAASGLE
jgi:hypothetical protein